MSGKLIINKIASYAAFGNPQGACLGTSETPKMSLRRAESKTGPILIRNGPLETWFEPLKLFGISGGSKGLTSWGLKLTKSRWAQRLGALGGAQIQKIALCAVFWGARRHHNQQNSIERSVWELSGGLKFKKQFCTQCFEVFYKLEINKITLYAVFSRCSAHSDLAK